MGDEGNRKEVTSSVDDIIEGFSRLLKILNQDETEGKGDGNEELDSGVRKLRKLHKEIVGIQEGIEKFQLFQEGQDLYTKWLALVEQSESENNIRGKDDKATDTQAAKETKVKGTFLNYLVEYITFKELLRIESTFYFVDKP